MSCLNGAHPAWSVLCRRSTPIIWYLHHTLQGCYQGLIKMNKRAFHVLSNPEKTCENPYPEPRHCGPSFFPAGSQFRLLIKTAGYAIFFARTLPSTLYSARTSMAAYLYTMLIQASLLARNAPYIAHARTLAQRTRLTALMLTFFPAARWHCVDSSAKDLKICCLGQQEPVIRRGGEEVEGRREETPVRRARREMSSQYTRPAGAFAAGSVHACHGGHDECRDGRGGTSGGVWRGGSSVSPRTFAARRKITSTGAKSPWGRWPTALAFDSAAASPPAAPGVAQWALRDGSPKKSEEGNSSAFFT